MGSGKLFLSVLTLLVASTAYGQRQQPDVPVKLSRRAESLIERQILPAFRAGDRQQLLAGLSDATQRMNPEQLEAFDERLQALGMQPAGTMMVDGYQSLLTQGVTDLPSPSIRELLVMVPAMSDAMDAVLDEVHNSVATLEPVPVLESMEDYEGLFWEMHVLKNRMEQAGNYARYGTHLLDQARMTMDRSRKTKSSELASQIDGLTADFEDRVNQLKTAYDDLQQRQFEFRLNRMELARSTLASSDDFMDRVRAAFAGQLDARMFQKQFAMMNAEEQQGGAAAQSKTARKTARKTRVAAQGAAPIQSGSVKFERERLKDPELMQDVAMLANQIDELSGEELKEKSRLLVLGTHWWLRGRYGSGPEQGGLLKNIRVIDDDRHLFPLFMPEAIGKPRYELVRNLNWQPSDDDGEGSSTTQPYLRTESSRNVQPDYPRRHHYGWMFEYRRPIGQTQSEQSGLVERTTEVVTTKTTSDRFY